MIKVFELPMLPPSINQTYRINYKTRQCYMHKDARQFKRDAYPLIPFMKIDDELINIRVIYYGKFINKNGTITRKDGQNLDKALYDIICEKFGIDDSRVFRGTWEKVHAPLDVKTKIKVYIRDKWWILREIEERQQYLEKVKLIKKLQSTS